MLLFSQVIDQAQKINILFNKSEQEIITLENKLSEVVIKSESGYMVAEKLKDAIMKRNSIKNQKDAINSLHSMIIPWKKQLASATDKIIENAARENNIKFKTACTKIMIDKKKSGNNSEITAIL